MRLNPDCIRDILLYIEENTTYNGYLEFPISVNSFEIDFFKNYSPDVVIYHFHLCQDYGYIKTNRGSNLYKFVERLTPLGHEFLENIRLDTTWNKTKDTAKKLGVSSLNGLKDIAVQVISNVISNKFK